MKSIRRSLIVYFLVLMTAALGAVSWFSYRMTEQSLRQRQRDAQKMIQAQYETRSTAERTDLDRRILRQARAMANMPLITIHYEAVFSIAAIAGALAPEGHVGHLGAGLWFAPPPPKNIPTTPTGIPLWLAPGPPQKGKF